MNMQAELAWERQMVDRGIERYKRMQNAAIVGGRFEQASSGKRLMANYLAQAADHIELYLSGKGETRRAPEAKILAGMDPCKIAFLGMKQMMRCLYIPQTYLVSVCAGIGKRIEDEFNFNKLEAAHKEYYDAAMRKLDDGNTKNTRHRAVSIITAARNANKIEVEYWTKHQRIVIGLIILRLIMAVTDLFTIRVSDSKYLVGAEGTAEWVQEHDDAMAMLYPDRLPMLIPPSDWTAFNDGGFYLPELRAITPMVITGKLNPKKRAKLYNAATMPGVYSAINTLQRVPWKINERVLGVMQDVWAKNIGIGMPRSAPYEFPACPLEPGAKATPEQEDEFKNWKNEMRTLYSLEATRVSASMQVARDLRLARELAEKDELYFVYRADFRGRLYATTTGLSPQGSDQSKALLQFARTKALGPRGVYWFKVHGANKYGYDKSTNDARVAWAEEGHERWLRVADDPIRYREFWQEADKPYQFLAWCFEYAEYAKVGEDFRSALPIARDGSCNGLQHFSAMLRDAVGGAAVNLTVSDLPADIYREVAGVATTKLRELVATDDDAGAKNWLWLFQQTENQPMMPRKLSKPPVMTLPYGSTQRTCTQSIYDWYVANADGQFGKRGFQHAVVLTPVLWKSIGEVVIAARSAMSWIRKCSGIVANAGHPIYFETPLGFPVYQRSGKVEMKRVKTAIDGQILVSMMYETDEIDPNRMRNGSSPNFVHAYDATHMMMVVNRAKAEGIECMAMIHDDFGTHACDIDRWDAIIRETFHELYAKHDALADFKKQLEDRFKLELPDTPPMGTLDIDEVLKSPFFFG